MSEKIWYAGIGGEQKGPFDVEELRAFASKVSVSELMVWKAGLAAWKPATEVDELGLKPSASAPPPLPVGPPPIPTAPPPIPSVPATSAVSQEMATVFFSTAPSQTSSQPRTTPSPASPPSASKTFGKYQILSEVARGGMGICYTARQEGLDRVVALKVLLQGKLADSEQIDRFFIEARAAAKLSHPNIVPIYDMGEVAGQYFYTMEYIDGQSLDRLIDRRPMQPKVIAQVALGIAQGLSAAHEARIVHRDIKPSNVLVKTLVKSGSLSQGDWERAEIKVLDFGLAGNLAEVKTLASTGVRTVMGTPHYMSPEQARGEIEKVDARSDIYSLGAMMYEMMTGATPTASIPYHEVIAATADEKAVIASPSTITRTIDPVLEIICMKAMRKKPENRYQTAAELAGDLERYLKGEKIKAKAPGFFERQGRRGGRAVALIAVAVIAMGAVAGWYATRPGVFKPAEINWMDAQKFIGKTVTVEVPVLKTFESQGRVALSPKPGDKTAFEGWIMAENFGAFPTGFKDLYWMKLVRATGKLEKNGEQPILRLTGASDIEVIRPLHGKERGSAAITSLEGAYSPSAENLISWKNAMDSLDKVVTVAGQVVEVKRTIHAVNFNFSNSAADFQVDCWNDAWENFPPEFENLYKGKMIWIAGKIASNKGRPIIKLHYPSQIKIVAGTDSTTAASPDSRPITNRAGRPRTR